MKLYLAHPILSRDEVRKAEHKFEEETGIELVNPFYDNIERGSDITEIDSGERKPYSHKLDYRAIVESDTAAILDCDGMVAVLTGKPSIGTFMEIMIAKQFNKQVFIVAWYKPFLTHPWLKYFCDAVVSSFEELKIILKDVC